jgi:hypothetical protein
MLAVSFSFRRIPTAAAMAVPSMLAGLRQGLNHDAQLFWEISEKPRNPATKQQQKNPQTKIVFIKMENRRDIQTAKRFGFLL